MNCTWIRLVHLSFSSILFMGCILSGLPNLESVIEVQHSIQEQPAPEHNNIDKRVREIIREIRAGINVAKNQNALVKQYTPLVYKIAHSCTVHMDLADLVQIGYLGLLKAIESYDPDAPTQFMTYAYTAIPNVMYREANYQRNLVYIPVNKIDDTIRIQRYITKKITEIGSQYHIRAGEYETVASELGMTLDNFKHCMLSLSHGNHHGIGGSVRSIDEASQNEDGNRDMGELLLSEYMSAQPITRGVMMENQDHAIKYALSKMNEFEAELLVLWYGLRGEEPHTLDEMLGLNLEDRTGKPFTSRSTLQRRCIESLNKFTNIVKNIGIDDSELV